MLRKLVFLLLLLPAMTLYGQLKIVPIGDSITQGDATNGSYRQQLWALFQSAGLAVDFVGSTNQFNNCGTWTGTSFDMDHESHWGYRADEILNEPASPCCCRSVTANQGLSDWLLGYDADIALIHIGTNDIIQGQSTGNILGEMGSIITELRTDNPNIAVFVAQLIPTEFGSYNSGINALNAALPGFVSSQSTSASPVILVDQNTGYDPFVDNHDQYHPGPTGQQKMAQNWFNAIDTYLNNPFPVVWGDILASETPDGHVRLQWETQQELNNLGFEVQLSGADQANYQEVGFVTGKGDSDQRQQYQFVFTDLDPGSYLARLVQIDADGQSSYSPQVAFEVQAPAGQAFHSFVTPGHSRLTIQSHVDLMDGSYTLDMLDMHGRSIIAAATLRQSETHLPLSQVSQGIYTVMIHHRGNIIFRQRVAIP